MIGRDSVPLNVHSISWSVSLSLTCLSVEKCSAVRSRQKAQHWLVSLVKRDVVCVRVRLEVASGIDDFCRNRLVLSVMFVDVDGARDARTMLFRCAVSSVVS